MRVNILSSSQRIADEIDNFLAQNKGLLTLTEEAAYSIQEKISYGTDDTSRILRSIMMLCPENTCYFSSVEMAYDIYPLGM